MINNHHCLFARLYKLVCSAFNLVGVDCLAFLLASLLSEQVSHLFVRAATKWGVRRDGGPGGRSPRKIFGATPLKILGNASFEDRNTPF